MYCSKEELIELTELTSPTKSGAESKTKKRNKIDLSPINSLTRGGKEDDIVNLFSIKKTLHRQSCHASTRNSDTTSKTISDTSDDVFIIEKVEGSSKSDASKSYKDKISNHLKNLRQKASSSHKINKYRTKIKLPFDRIRRESKDVDADIELVKNKFKRHRGSALERATFFSFKRDEKKQDNEQTDENGDASTEEMVKKSTRYALPEQLCFNVELSEKECFFVPDKQPVDAHKKVNEESSSLQDEDTNVPYQSKIRKRHLYILEKRLLSTEDKKWFRRDGELDFLGYPLTGESLRPTNVKYLGRDITNYKSATAKEECSEIVIVKDNILELHLSHLKFTFHPLFSIEHFFVQKLNDLYELYADSNENNNLEKIKSDLEPLRYSRDNIEITNESRNSESKKLLNINKELRKMRNFYFEQGRKERDTLKSILETWKIIKKIRENQQYSNTNTKLLIKKEKVDLELEIEERKKIIEEFLEEIVREQKAQRGEKDKKESDGDGKSDNEEKPSEHLDFDIDEQAIKNELKKKFGQSFRAPGEPILKLLLTTGNEITEDIQNRRETMRRHAISSTKIYMKILCNKVEVCKSKPIILNDNFSLDIEETFSIQLTNIPDFLSIEIIEQPKGLLKKKICEINVNMPAQNIPQKNNKLHKTSFEKNEIVHYKHEGIGSGINLKTVITDLNLTIPIKDDLELNTAGYLQYYIGWEKLFKETNKDSIESQFNLLNDITDKNLVINENKLSEWMNDPDSHEDLRGSVFMEYMEGCNRNTKQNDRNRYFRLSPHAESYKYCDISAIEQNIRLKILQLRNQNEIEFDGMVIPNRTKEIPTNILADYKRRKATESKCLSKEEEDINEDEIEIQRNFGKKYLKQVHTQIFQRCKSYDNNLAYESVVDEKYLIYFELMVKTLLRNFLNWFRWQPKISKPLPLTVENLHEGKPRNDYDVKTQANIIIKVNYGKNIPNRTKHTFTESWEGEPNMKKENTENEVRPFVEITYENLSARTNNSKGVNPTWNETLTLPLESQHSDYLNPNSLNGSIIVNVFDENETEIKKINKKSINWLGRADISLSAICYSGSMEGSFKLKLPEVLLGYETKIEKHKLKSPKVNNVQSYSHHTYLHMEINIQPNIPKLTANMEELPCGEVPYLQEHIMKWNQAYNNSFPNRKFSALAIDTNAKTACITRYLKPLEPPQINLDEFDVTPEQCLRYVSLIPFTECNQFYQNVWLTTDQLLHLMIGSTIDHAVTLTCYLLALKMDVWLLLGYGIPHGSTAYVLAREYAKETETPTYYIYDVVYNEKYNLTDMYCPLQRIYCIVNGENVWANTQRSDTINTVRFDTSRRSDWLPLFTNNISAPTNFINHKVTYKLKNYTENVENQLERKIKKKITKLRQLDRTIWNNHIANVFKNILKSFEINCMYNKNHFETLTELNEKISSYNVTGYVLNTAFTSTSAIVRKIKSLGIHIQEERNTEFALGIYVQTYPGQLLSVWILIANIVNKSLYNIV